VDSAFGKQATETRPDASEESASHVNAVDASGREDETSAEPEVSRKKKKKLARMTVTELKKQVKRPEVVEVHDVTSADPLTLVHLKAYRSTVPVPRHWCLKRRYLQVCGARGQEPVFRCFLCCFSHAVTA
jgi:splicing factor 3B subunit 2